METLGTFWQDIRYAVRGLGKDRSFTALSIFTLALGIGAATVIFCVVDHVMLEPFPYANANRIAVPVIRDPSRAQDEGRNAYAVRDFLDLKEQNHIFEDVIGRTPLDVIYTNDKEIQQFTGAWVTPNTFNFLGVKPLLGRPVVPEDGQPGAAPVFAMSYRLWNAKFNRDPKIIGTAFTLNNESRTLVAIMPPRVLYGGADVWLPLTLNAGNNSAIGNRPLFLTTWGRLKPGINLQAATADLDVVIHRWSQAFPNDYPKRLIPQVRLLTDAAVGRFGRLMFILVVAVMLLLLIGCSNVANLLLARSTAREREIAVRASLGASRWRLVRQLLVESFVLATCGCLLGWLFAYIGIRGVTVGIPEDSIPPEAVITLSPIVLIFSLALTCVTTLIFGLLPAVHAVRGDLNSRLRNSSKTGASARQGKLRGILVVSEITLSIILLIGAGLMMRSLFALEHVDLGFNPVNVLHTRIPLPRGRYDTAEQKKLFFQNVMHRVQGLPGVISVSETIGLPPFGGPRTDLTIPGKTHAERWDALFDMCSEQYFQTLGIPLRRGQEFTQNDIESARLVTVINEKLARSYFGDEDPIGKRIKFNVLNFMPDAPHDAYFEVIGVVGNIKNRGVQDPPLPQAFVPYTITGFGDRSLLIKTQVDPQSILDNVRRNIWEVDHNVTLAAAGTLEHNLQQFSYSQPQFGLVLLGIFGGIGLALVAIGVFSVMAYTVSLQTHEIGVRMALGARPGKVLNMILGNGLRLIFIGIVLGGIGSFLLTRLVANQFWGVSITDPFTYGAVVTLLVAIGLLACMVPARRAARVDPLVALRYE